MAVNIHITIIELNALHTKRQNLFQELDAVIHLLMEAKHWGLRKSRNATSLNSRFKSLRSEERRVGKECRSGVRASLIKLQHFSFVSIADMIGVIAIEIVMII